MLVFPVFVGLRLFALNAVSYTHLDVYKRQHPGGFQTEDLPEIDLDQRLF